MLPAQGGLISREEGLEITHQETAEKDERKMK